VLYCQEETEGANSPVHHEPVELISLK